MLVLIVAAALGMIGFWGTFAWAYVLYLQDAHPLGLFIWTMGWIGFFGFLRKNWKLLLDALTGDKG